MASTNETSTLRKFPFQRDWPLSQPPEMAEVRKIEPISKVQLWDGSTAWLATRYADIKQLLNDRALSSAPCAPDFRNRAKRLLHFERANAYLRAWTRRNMTYTA